MTKKKMDKKHKLIYIIGAIAALLLIAVFAICVMMTKIGGNGLHSQITSFIFSKGYGLGGAVSHTIVRQGNKAHLLHESFSPDGEKKKVEKDIDVKYLDQLANIIEKENIQAWNGFNKSESLMDGPGFTLKIEYENGKKIEAHGYGSFPDNYDDVNITLSTFLDTITQ